MGWPTEKLLQLIQLFEKAPCLWDPLNRNYKKSVVKDRAWQTISNVLGYNAIETKKKMESLLASYRRERKKHEIDPYHVSKWFAYKPLSFLSNRTFVRKEQQDPLREIMQPEKSPSQDSYDLKRSKVNIEETETVPLMSERYKESSPCGHTNKIKPEKNKRDASDIFGEYVATKHRKYCDHVKNVVEHQIAQILFDADMGTYNPGTTTTITISGRATTIETEAEELEEFNND